MALAPVFHARVLPGGLLVLDRPKDYATHVRSFAGQFVDVIVRKRQSQRSLDQSAYLHAVPFRLLSDAWGEDMETTKLLCLGECFGWKDTKDGHRLPMKPHTSLLTVEEGSHLIEWLPPWAMVNFSVEIPLPNEVAA